MDRNRLVSARDHADSLRGRWQALLDKMNAERLKQMSFDDEQDAQSA